MEDADVWAGEGNNIPQGDDKGARLAHKSIAEGACLGGGGGKGRHLVWSQT